MILFWDKHQQVTDRLFTDKPGTTSVRPQTHVVWLLLHAYLVACPHSALQPGNTSNSLCPKFVWNKVTSIIDAFQKHEQAAATVVGTKTEWRLARQTWQARTASISFPSLSLPSVWLRLCNLASFLQAWMCPPLQFAYLQQAYVSVLNVPLYPGPWKVYLIKLSWQWNPHLIELKGGAWSCTCFEMSVSIASRRVIVRPCRSLRGKRVLANSAYQVYESCKPNLPQAR